MVYKMQKEFFRKSYETGEHGWPVEVAAGEIMCFTAGTMTIFLRKRNLKKF